MGISFAAARAALVDIGRRFDRRGWAPATSGNYSVRLDDGTVAVTMSGRHKGRLVEDDILRVDMHGMSLDGKKPSAETALHLSLYRLFPDIGAVLHGHSSDAVGLSRAVAPAREWVFRGHEMLKALPGVTTHALNLRLPIVENSQDMRVIEAEVLPALAEQDVVPAYLIRAHGLYAWGADLEEAERVFEAVEWLIGTERAEMDFRKGVSA